MTQASLLDWKPAEPCVGCDASSVGRCRRHEEPTPEHYQRDADDPRDYSSEFVAWRTEHPEAYASIERAALALLAAGAERIEVNDLWADARRTFKVRANNSYRAACARALRDEHPALAGVIRIRAARRTR